MSDFRTPDSGSRHERSISTISEFEEDAEDHENSELYARLRNKAIEEFFQTEKTYVEGIRTIVRIYVLRLKKSLQFNRAILSEEEIQQAFVNIEDIYDLNTKLLDELTQLREKGTISQFLGRTLMRFIPFFKLYTLYVNKFQSASDFIQQLKKARTAFAQFVELQEACENQPLESFLIMPVQRVPRYLLLLESLVKYTPHSDPSAGDLARALAEVKNVATYINSSFHNVESRMRVVHISEELFGGQLNLVSPQRYYVRHGALKKIYNKSHLLKKHKKYVFFLFNDILMYATRASTFDDYCQLKHVLPLVGMTIDEVPDTPDIQHAFQIRSSTKSFVVYAPNEMEKAGWVLDLQRHIAIEEKNNASLARRDLDAFTLERFIKNELTEEEMKQHDAKTPSEEWAEISSGVWYNAKTGDTSTVPPSEMSAKLTKRATLAAKQALDPEIFGLRSPPNSPSAQPSPPHMSLRGKKKKSVWKKAVDSLGRTYYYHRTTRQSVWRKPPGE